MDEPSRADEILSEWAALRDRGETIDIEDLIRANPEIADELRDRIATLTALEAVPVDSPSGRILRSLDPGRYAEFRIAGEGGMGIVYWALDTDLNRQVAFKIVRPDLGGKKGETPTEPLGLSIPDGGTPASNAFETLKSRFLQEAWVTAGLEHPGIVPVYELGQTPEGVPYYTMRFVRGSRTLATAIDRLKDAAMEDRLELLEVFLRVCDTIRYAHAHGVIHRDLKPENIALGEFGEVVVLDWGLAKMRDREDTVAETWQERLKEYREASDLQTMASAMGTPGYMSPEAALGRVDQIDAVSDVYSLGSILFKILTGRLPYEFASYRELVNKLVREPAASAREIEPEVPAELSEICAKSLLKEKADRFAGAAEFAEAVRRWQRASAVEREVRDLLAKAEAAFEGTEGLEGELLLKQLDRVTSACSRVNDRAPGHSRAASLVRRSERLRERAIAEREQAARVKLLRRVAAAAIVMAVLVAGTVIFLVDAKRREAESARARAESAEEETARALVETEAERDLKDRALTEARALALANASAVAEAEDPQRALLLAVAAGRVRMSPEVTTRLHDVLVHVHEVVQFRGHLARLNSAVFSPAGDRVLTASADNTARLWDLEGHPLAVLRGHWRSVGGGAFSRTGDRVLTWSPDRTIRIWDLEGNQLSVLRGHTDAIFSARFSLNGTRILSSSRDRSVRVWDTEGREIAAIRGEKSWATHASFLPSGQEVLAVFGGEVRILSLAGGEPVSFHAHEQDVTRAQLSPSGEFLLTASRDGTARLFRLTGEMAAAFQGHEKYLTWAGFFPSGDKVLTLSGDGTGRLWDLRGGPVSRFPATGAAAIARGGDRIATWYRGQPVRLWDGDGKPVAELRGHEGQHRRALWTTDGQHLLTVGEGGVVHVWDRNGSRVAQLRGHEGRVGSVAVSSDGSRVMTTEADGRAAHLWSLSASEVATLRHGVREGWRVKADISRTGDRVLTLSSEHRATVWDLAGRELGTFESPDPQLFNVLFSPAGDRVLTVPWRNRCVLWGLDGRVIARFAHWDAFGGMASFSPDGSRILTTSSTGAYLWDDAGKKLAILSGHGASVHSAVFSPDGRLFLTASDDGTARLWDPVSEAEIVSDREPPIRAARQLAVLEHRKRVNSAVFDPAGKAVLTSGYDGLAIIWDLSGRRLAVLSGHEGPVTSAVYSVPTGAYVLTSSEDRTARLWDRNGTLLAVLRGHGGPVNSAVFSPKGDRILTGSDDGTARLWDFEGRQVAVLRGHAGPVAVARFFPSGRHVLTSSADGTARIWVARDEELLRLAESRACRDLCVEEWDRYGRLLGEEPPEIRAERRVSDLLESLVLVDDVVAALAADADLEAAEREAAIRLAEARRHERVAGHRIAYEILRLPGRSEEQCLWALRLAEAAHAVAPDCPVDISTLGRAQYRVGRFEEAVGTLRRADALNNAGAAFYPRVYDLAFLSMALHRLGRPEEARAPLKLCLERLRDPYVSVDEDWRDYVEEARAVADAHVVIDVPRYRSGEELRYEKLVGLPEWQRAAPPRNEQGFIEAVHVRTGLTFVLIPGGEFLMGSDEQPEAAPVHRVTVPPFLLCRTECPMGVWKSGGGQWQPATKNAADLPVWGASWTACHEWCERNGLRLPSEAEWEYACRAGSTGRWCFGSLEASLAEYAWFDLELGNGPYPVAGKKPNAFGLFDMHGNAPEWCRDRWHATYDRPGRPDDGSAGDSPASPPSPRVQRGGYYTYPADWLSSHHRDSGNQDAWGLGGFRPATSLPD